MKLKKLLYAFTACALLFTACDSDDDPEVIPKLTSNGSETAQINVKLGESVSLNPELNTEDVDYKWMVDEEFASNEKKFVFNPDKIGDYNILFVASNSSGKVEYTYSIIVYKLRESNKESSPYLSELIEYKPAPGQFMNEGGYEDPEGILGKPEYNMLSLGGFGGYVKVAFDHTIVNRKGKEIVVYGNAFDGSSEPGIVMVSFDYNGNGKADDEWYELAGSEYNAEKTIHNYEITYTNPHQYADIPWTDNQGNSGVLKINEFHQQNYYPEFIEDQETVTFTGTLLENKTDLDYSNDVYQHIVYNPAREWGYVDNYSSEYENFKGNTFDIEWAVNSDGEKVELPGVDFIKVYTATNVNGGWLGENSTEILGAADMLLLE